MSSQHDPEVSRRDRKRLATREAISERGFEAVSVDEIARAADVGRMTVFNHFPRKEDMLFDRIEEAQTLVRLVLREATEPPVEALRQMAHRLVAEDSPWLNFAPARVAFLTTIDRSETLRSRARAIRDEFAAVLAAELASREGEAPGAEDPELLAGLIAAVWAVALVRSWHHFQHSRDGPGATGVFLAVVDRGSRSLLGHGAGD